VRESGRSSSVSGIIFGSSSQASVLANYPSVSSYDVVRAGYWARTLGNAHKGRLMIAYEFLTNN